MSNDLGILVPWVIAHGYLLILLVGIIEGPFMALAAGIAVALGYFNIYIIIVLAFLGDTIGDLFYYGLGYLGSNFNKFAFLKKLINQPRAQKIKKILLNNTVRAVVIIKLSPGVGFLGLIVLGSIRASFKKLVKTAILVSIPKSILFVLIGYWAGQAYLQLDKTIAQGRYIVLGITIFLLLGYFAYLKLVKLITRKLERKE